MCFQTKLERPSISEQHQHQSSEVSLTLEPSEISLPERFLEATGELGLALS
jgi:hypothetical protein